MKKTFFLIAALVMAANSFAQKANLRKIENITYNVQNMNSLPAEKWEEIRTLVNEAKVHPETADNYKTWDWVARVKLYDRTKMLMEYQANNNQFSDIKAFFMNEAEIVEAFEKYYQLLQTPNEKGKLPVKEAELQNLKIFAQTNAEVSRPNIYVGATQFVYTEPAVAVQLLEKYYASFDSPLFEGLDLKNKDENYKNSAYVYATALKGAGADKAKVKEWLTKSLETENGPLACQDLITLAHEEGNTAKEKEYLMYAYQNYPKYMVFAINLAQEALQNKDYDECIKYCDEIQKRYKDGTIPPTDDNGNPQENYWYSFYFKAVSYFNTEKYDKAYEAFVEGDDECPDHIELVMGAGTAAAKQGNNFFEKKDKAKPWYEKAIKYLSKAEEKWPDQPDEWGYQLYACYHNLENKAMEAKYKKYANK